jgi:nucleotide-binding universal stress UspA family protein
VADLEAGGIDVESRLVAHRPADAILQVAEEVDARMILVGTVRENPIAGVVLGSVVLNLVQRSPFPVLVVRAPDA